MSIFNVLTSDPLETQEFVGQTIQEATTHPSHTWRKPKGLRFSSWLVIGAGGGGGAGLTVTGGNSSGGAGGAGAPYVRAIFDNSTLPDVLYVYVTSGSPGGATSASSGLSGGRTWISTTGATGAASTTTLLLVSGGAVSGGGGGGLLASGASGGTASSPISLSAIWSVMALAWQAFPGQNGGASNSGLDGDWPPAAMISGGAGGGGTTTGSSSKLGGSQTTVGPYIGNSVNSTDGFFNLAHGLMYAQGGTGGTGNDLIDGTRGGDGANYGAGGGGGGSGINFGPGGKGGSGYCRVDCW